MGRKSHRLKLPGAVQADILAKGLFRSLDPRFGWRKFEVRIDVSLREAHSGKKSQEEGDNRLSKNRFMRGERRHAHGGLEAFNPLRDDQFICFLPTDESFHLMSILCTMR